MISDDETPKHCDPTSRPPPSQLGNSGKGFFRHTGPVVLTAAAMMYVGSKASASKQTKKDILKVGRFPILIVPAKPATIVLTSPSMLAWDSSCWGARCGGRQPASHLHPVCHAGMIFTCSHCPITGRGGGSRLDPSRHKSFQSWIQNPDINRFSRESPGFTYHSRHV